MSAPALTELFASWLADDPQRTGDPGLSRLAQLLRLRPDLCVPPPPDLSALAARALTRASVSRALDGLDLPHLQVLESMTALGLSTTEEIATFLGVPEHQEIPDDVLQHLHDLALVWPTGPTGAWRTPAQVSAVVGNPCRHHAHGDRTGQGAASHLVHSGHQAGALHQGGLDAQVRQGAGGAERTGGTHRCPDSSAADSGTCSKASRSPPAPPHRVIGQAMTSARPVTSSRSMNPSPGPCWCMRESAEALR